MPTGKYIRTKWHKEINSKGHLGLKLSTITKKRMSQSRTGIGNPKWVGNRRKHGRYIFAEAIGHPQSMSSRIYEHRLVIEKHIGRYLTSKEIVHHINKNSIDNRLSNLMLLKNQCSHIKIHLGKELQKEEILFNGKN